MGARVIVKVQYKKTIEGVTKNAQYIGFRAREHEEEQKGFFNKQMDTGADLEIYLSKIRNHPALQHESTVKAHTMILSFREDDYKAMVEAGGDFKDIARDLMKDLENRKGMDLTWIGAFHNKSGHPHVHLSIMSVGQTPDGKNKRLTINKEDLAWLPKNLESKLERYVPEQEREQVQSRTRTRGKRRNHVSRQAERAAQKLSSITRNLEEQNSGRAGKTNQKRRKRRVKSRIEQQRQPQPPVSPQH